jgi:hypothetical protein
MDKVCTIRRSHHQVHNKYRLTQLFSCLSSYCHNVLRSFKTITRWYTVTTKLSNYATDPLFSILTSFFLLSSVLFSLICLLISLLLFSVVFYTRKIWLPPDFRRSFIHGVLRDIFWSESGWGVKRATHSYSLSFRTRGATPLSSPVSSWRSAQLRTLRFVLVLYEVSKRKDGQMQWNIKTAYKRHRLTLSWTL